MTKKEITEDEYFNIAGDLGGSIDDAIEHLKRLKDEGFNRLKAEYIHTDGDISAYAIYPQKIRLETDEEEANRISFENKLDESYKLERLKQYEALKKEFGE